MIKSFRHRGLKRLCESGGRSGIRADQVETVRRILSPLDGAPTPQALDLPRSRFHSLKGEMKGFWDVTVRANWRVVFRFEGGGAAYVLLMEYH